MIPRGKLSIKTGNLWSALAYCFSYGTTASVQPAANYGSAIFCLSARTGLDLTLKALSLPVGSEIIVCNVNIPDMFAILQAHGLTLVPLPINPCSLEPAVEEIETRITPRTKLLLITHLFGAIVQMNKINELAKKHQLIVIEDCAQAFNGEYKGDSKTDVALFSFGLIKTNTCLTGGLAVFNNALLFEKVKLLNQQLPVQPTRKYLAKILKALAIKLITTKLIYTLLYQALKLLDKDFDDALAGLTKGFPGKNVVQKIAFQPCLANLRLLKKRTESFSQQTMINRKKTALKIIDTIPNEMKVGTLNRSHTYWVLPVYSEDPAQLVQDLRSQGIDATTRASSLVKIGEATQPHKDELNLKNLVYIPGSSDELIFAKLQLLKKD